MKTRGVMNEETGKKDFVITYKGEDHYCKRYNTKSFMWNGHRGTLKTLKLVIKDHYEKPAVDEQEPVGLWESADVHALLSICYYQAAWLEDDMKHLIVECLGNNGYLLEDGTVDINQATEAVDGFRKRVNNG